MEGLMGKSSINGACSIVILKKVSLLNRHHQATGVYRSHCSYQLAGHIIPTNFEYMYQIIIEHEAGYTNQNLSRT